MFSTNTYILSDTERKTAIIFGRLLKILLIADAPGNVNGIVEYLKSIGVERVEAVFLTHGHLDHILAMNELRKKLPGEWKAYLGEPDLKLWYFFPCCAISGERSTNSCMTLASP